MIMAATDSTDDGLLLSPLLKVLGFLTRLPTSSTDPELAVCRAFL